MTDTIARQGGRLWYHGWNVVAVCVLAGIAANGLPINAYSLFLHDWSVELHQKISVLQLGIASLGIVTALLGPLVGIWADKYSLRMLYTIGLAGMTVFCLGISFVTQFYQYIVLYAGLLPISILLTTSLLSNVMVSRWFVRRLGLALSITAFGLSMAGIVMPPLVAVVMPLIGWRGIWRIGGALIGLVVLPLVLFALRDPHERDGTHYLTGAAGAATPHHGGGPAGGGASGLSWGEVLSRRNFWMLIVVYLPMLALYGGCQQNLAPIAASRGLSQQTAGALLSLLCLSQLAVTLLAGMLSDRFGNRFPLAGLAFATAIGGLLVAFGGGFVMFAAGVALVGVGGAFWPLIASAVAKEFGLGGVGRVFGLVTFFLPLGVLSPVGIAITQEKLGSYKPAFVLMIVLSILGGAACALLMREKRSTAA